MCWPRSREPAAELPELIAAASLRLGGPVTRVSLNIEAWDAHLDTITGERIIDRLQSEPRWPTTPATLLDFGAHPQPQPEE